MKNKENLDSVKKSFRHVSVQIRHIQRETGIQNIDLGKLPTMQGRNKMDRKNEREGKRH